MKLAIVLLASALFAQDTIGHRVGQRATPIKVGTYSEASAPINAINAAQFARSMSIVQVYTGWISPTQGVYDFTSPDVQATFAATNGMRIKLHPLMWDYGCCIPDWLKNGTWTPTTLLAALLPIIDATIDHFNVTYPGRMLYVDVLNEWLGNAAPATGGLTLRTDSDTELYETAPGLPGVGDITTSAYVPSGVEALFQEAHTKCPSCLLGYNDYGAELSNTNKWTNILNLVAMMQRDGLTPGNGLDYIGFQTHLAYNDSYSTSTVNGHVIITAMDAHFTALGALGLKSIISEMDVTDPDGTHSTQQATVYGDVMRTCYYNVNCVSWSTWGICDSTTWLPGQHPLPWDDSCVPKPALAAILGAMPPPRIFPMPGGLVR